MIHKCYTSDQALPQCGTTWDCTHVPTCAHQFQKYILCEKCKVLYYKQLGYKDGRLPCKCSICNGKVKIPDVSTA